jgi:hypothetical protein
VQSHPLHESREKTFHHAFGISRGVKTVVIMTGDDHANGGTAVGLISTHKQSRRLLRSN